MSQSIEQSDLFKTFLADKEYVEIFLCPYCGKTFDEPSEGTDLRCCEEPHIDRFWVNDRESLDAEDVRKAFQSWCDDRSDAAADEPKVNRWDNLTASQRGDS